MRISRELGMAIETVYGQLVSLEARGLAQPINLYGRFPGWIVLGAR